MAPKHNFVKIMHLYAFIPKVYPGLAHSAQPPVPHSTVLCTWSWGGGGAVWNLALEALKDTPL